MLDIRQLTPDALNQLGSALDAYVQTRLEKARQLKDALARYAEARKHKAELEQRLLALKAAQEAYSRGMGW